MMAYKVPIKDHEVMSEAFQLANELARSSSIQNQSPCPRQGLQVHQAFSFLLLERFYHCLDSNHKVSMQPYMMHLVLIREKKAFLKYLY